MNAKLLHLPWTAALLLAAATAHGQAIDPPPAGSFTIAVMPDTQNYTITASRREIFLGQTRWIAEHAESFGIAFVLHEGDIVENNIAPQWEMAREAFDLLDAAGVPYVMAVGNHDYGPNGNGATRDSGFNEPRFFGRGSPYADQAGVGGFFEEGRTDNSFHLLRAGGREWIVLALEWQPRPEVLEWADAVLDGHPGRAAILVTHEYLGGNGQRTISGQLTWNRLVSRHDFAFVFCGHVLASARSTSVGAASSATHEVLANYQHLALGGSGYMRLVEILPDGRAVRVRTYSPFLDSLMRGAVEEFPLVLCAPLEDTQRDADRNRIPDECEPDCNGNGIPDEADIRGGRSPDANRNGIPDECDLRPAFAIEPKSGEAPLDVIADASATATRPGSSIVSLEWDFGEGEGAAGMRAAHTFARPGAATVTLTARDDRALRETVSQRVRVLFPPGPTGQWISSDVGEPAFPGAARSEGGCLTVFAGGRTLTSTGDRFHFLHRPIGRDDVVLVARIDAVDPDAASSTVGLMVRESLDPGARHAAVVIRRASGRSRRFGLYRRLEAGTRARLRSGPVPAPAAPWLRIERRGDDLIPAFSEDGETWTALETVTLPGLGAAFAGVAASAIDTRGDLATITARVCGLELSRPGFVRGDADGTGAVEIADGVSILSFLFLGETTPPCLDAADTDDSGRIDIVDAIAIFHFLVRGGAPPPDPGPVTCAPDPGGDDLGCAAPACRIASP